jgi:ABC-type multidrug transport system permease subunit
MSELTAFSLLFFIVGLWCCGLWYALYKGDELWERGFTCGMIYVLISALVLAMLGTLRN